MLYAIGDIHGEIRKLRGLLELIDQMPLRDEDRLIFVGDYIDRGPGSKAVIDRLIRLKQVRPNTVFLRGNHDQVMLDARDVFDRNRKSDLSYEDVMWWFAHGGRNTIASYGDALPWYEQVPPDHWKFLEDTVLEHREAGYAFVHAGLLPPGLRWKERDDPRLWVRDEFIRSTAEFGAVVVYGHTPINNEKPKVQPNKVGIDTGAAYGGPLTALVIDPSSPYDPRAVQYLQAE
jgi:serine/threonine protein phosphatase 1